MKIFLFSGSGAGAGKSTAARSLTQDVWSLANAIRQELTYRYPNYNWYNKSQKYKDETIISEWKHGTQSMREVMIEYGQLPCNDNPSYWAEKLVHYLNNRHFISDGVSIIGIDDLRKVCELETIKQAFPGQVTHFHMATPAHNVLLEPMFDNDELARRADYTLTWSNR